MARKPAALQEQIDGVIAQGAGWCRANQHIWQNPSKRGNGALRVEKGVVTVTFKCANCTGKRVDNISLRSGELLARHYEMPDGYILHLEEGQIRPSKSEWRKEHYQDLVGTR